MTFGTLVGLVAWIAVAIPPIVFVITWLNRKPSRPPPAEQTRPRPEPSTADEPWYLRLPPPIESRASRPEDVPWFLKEPPQP